MEALLQDFRYGLRMLKSSPIFTLVAVLSLALGIGANITIFSVINAVIMRPLPYQQPDQLVMIWNSSTDRERSTVTPADFLDWRAQNDKFAELAAVSNVTFNLAEDGESERILATSASTNFFQLLGVNAALGETFSSAKNSDDWRVVVLSNRLWRRRFGSDGAIVGRKILLNNQPYRVIGVMPEQFNWPRLSPSFGYNEEAELWLPARKKDIPELGGGVDRDLTESRSAGFIRVIGRLKRGVELSAAKEQFSAIAAGLARQYPETNLHRGVTLIPLSEQLTGNIKPVLMVLFVAVGFVLLIACANTANLILTRALARRNEFAVRAALGAGRSRLIRQLLTESLVQALLAGGCGLLMTLWGIPLLVSLSPANIPRLDQVNIDLRVVAFTLALSLLTGLLFGIIPALQTARLDLNELLKSSHRRSAHTGKSRRLLVVSQVIMALVLLIGAGLLLKSFLLLSQVKPGFDPENLLTFKISLSPQQYSKEQQAQFFQQALAEIKQLPGVEQAGATLTLPMAGDDISLQFTVEGRVVAPGEEISIGYQTISPDYFGTMRIPLLKGRDFTYHDRADSTGVVIINETAARRIWPDEDPIGKRVKIGNETGPWLNIVGIAADVRHYGLNRAPRAEAYVPFKQNTFSFMDIAVRTDSAPLKLVPAIRELVTKIDRNQPIASITTMATLMDSSVAQIRYTSFLIAFFGLTALMLAVVGIYGVISYSVAQRTQEIGVRMALGAQPLDIFRLIIGEGMKLILTGSLLGMLAAFALTRVLAGMLFGVSTADTATFLVIPGLIIIVALIACYLPARRATKIDPMAALREQ